MSKDIEQIPLFDNIDDFDIQEREWQNMPEYNNINEPRPVIVATFKFKTEDDFLKFKSLIQEHIYNGEKVFDGMQKINEKNAWYPHKKKASSYEYI